MIRNKQFKYLFDRYANSVASVLSYYFSEDSEVEDGVQDVFMKVWEKRDIIDPNHPGVKGYLLKMARNHALYRLKQEKNLLSFEHDDIEKASEPVNSLQEKLAKKELSMAYKRALRHVPPRTKEAFTLSRDQGLTYHQIADKMQISPKTVEGLISYALKILRSELHEFRV